MRTRRRCSARATCSTKPEGARITRFHAQDAGATFLAYFLLGPGQEPELTFPAG